MKKIAIAEIGTNSLKLLKTKVVDGKLVISYQSKVTTRLGRFLFSKNMLCTKAKQIIIDNIQSFKNNLSSNYYLNIIATEGLRKASDSNVFISQLNNLFDTKLQLISAFDEAYYSYLAAKSELNFEQAVIFDSGGGSTDIYFSKIKKVVSLKYGAVNFTEQMLKQKLDVNTALSFLITEFKKQLPNYEAQYLVGIGGSATTIACVKKPGSIAKKVSLKNIDNQIKMYANYTIDEIKNIKGLNPDRAEIILAGSLIIKAVLIVLKANKYVVCKKGLRHGYALKKYQLA